MQADIVVVVDKCSNALFTFRNILVPLDIYILIFDRNLTFDGDLFVSLAKDINSADSNEVMFSISRKKRKIIISQMDIDKLISKIKEVQKIIEDAAKI